MTQTDTHINIHTYRQTDDRIIIILILIPNIFVGAEFGGPVEKNSAIMVSGVVSCAWSDLSVNAGF